MQIDGGGITIEPIGIATRAGEVTGIVEIGDTMPHGDAVDTGAIMAVGIEAAMDFMADTANSTQHTRLHQECVCF